MVVLSQDLSKSYLEDSVQAGFALMLHPKPDLHIVYHLPTPGQGCLICACEINEVSAEEELSLLVQKISRWLCVEQMMTILQYLVFYSCSLSL